MTAKFKQKGISMKDMEQVLLNNTSLDEIIKMKIEEEFKSNYKQEKQKITRKTITELKDVPKEQIFSKNAVFRVYNRDNKTESLINGIQADAMIGIQTGIREKILEGSLTVFSTENTYVKFEKCYV